MLCPFGAGSGLLTLVLIPGNRKCAEPGVSSLHGPPRLPQPSCCTDDTSRAAHRLPRLQPWTQSEPDPALRSEAFPLLPREGFFFSPRWFYPPKLWGLVSLEKQPLCLSLFTCEMGPLPPCLLPMRTKAFLLWREKGPGDPCPHLCICLYSVETVLKSKSTCLLSCDF